MTFTRKEAAQMIGVSLRTLDRHIAAGKLTVERTEAQTFEQAVTITLKALGKYLGITDEAQLRARLGLPKAEPERGAVAQPSSEIIHSQLMSAPEPVRPLTR